MVPARSGPCWVCCHCTTLNGDFNKIYAPTGPAMCRSSGSNRRARSRYHRHANLVSATLTQMPRHTGRRRRSRSPAQNRKAATGSDQRPASRARAAAGTAPQPRTLLERSAQSGSVGFLARSLIERLGPRVVADQGTVLVQTWCFGDEMAMVFLAGVAVVDYAQRLRWETDQELEFLIAAYSNDVPC